MTRYLVLLEEGPASYRTVADGIVARSDKAAVDQVASALEEPPAEARYIAVPQRHWHPRFVRTSIQTKLEIT